MTKILAVEMIRLNKLTTKNAKHLIQFATILLVGTYGSLNPKHPLVVIEIITACWLSFEHFHKRSQQLNPLTCLNIL